MIVQHIETRWTKRSRGMPGAAARNAVPHAMPLPLLEGPPGALHLHRVTVHENEGFFPYQKTGMGLEVDRYWAFTFVPAGDAVEVRFQYDRYLFTDFPPHYYVDKRAKLF